MLNTLSNRGFELYFVYDKICLMLTVGILTISDKGWHGQRYDESGQVIKKYIRQLSANVVKYEVIPDEKDVISAKLREWADEDRLDLIVTSGGTGLSPRDVTPEATLAVVDKIVPGLTEAMRFETVKKTPRAMLSRAVAGIRGKCLIVNLPGSPKGVEECFEVILPVLPHAIEVLKGEATECAANEGS